MALYIKHLHIVLISPKGYCPRTSVFVQMLFAKPRYFCSITFFFREIHLAQSYSEHAAMNIDISCVYRHGGLKIRSLYKKKTQEPASPDPDISNLVGKKLMRIWILTMLFISLCSGTGCGKRKPRRRAFQWNDKIRQQNE